jgi:hypothetical protein
MKRRIVLAAVVAIAVFIVISVPRIAGSIERRRMIAEQNNVVVPPPEVRLSSSSSSSSSLSQSSVSVSVPSSSVRNSVNWDVPFTPQAPLANWDTLHEEACEEASVLMALRYFQGVPIGSSQQAEDAIQKLVADNAALGFPVDDTAEQIVKLIAFEDPALTVKLLSNPTAEDIKKVLSEGKLVIVPAAGQKLGNPYFTAPGPKYHMLLIRGYTDTGYAITNDPGTKRGKAYVYRWDVLLAALHDWNGGDVENGAKVVIVVSK